MNYKFPEIRTINDVLPHIEGRDEFIVADKGDYTVINYAVSMIDTFDMSGPDDLGGAIRRECRGLIFDKEGKLISRPFHKFFNVNERPETQSSEIDISKPHMIMEKMDGSMIRPLISGGIIRLGTKMGVTEVSEQAEKYLASRKDYAEISIWMERCVKLGLTPIFEFVAPTNQIVIGYEEPDLVLLAIRDNVSGNYLVEQNSTPAGLTRVPVYGSVNESLADYIVKARERENREGDIIRFADGHMIKIKNDWYVRIHKTLDRVTFDRNIVSLILNEEIDDAVGLLPNATKDRIVEFEKRFSERLHALVEGYERYYETVVASGLDRKRYAQEWMPTIQKNDSFAPQYVFGRFVGKDGRGMILAHIEKHITSNTKWDECAKWMGM